MWQLGWSIALICGLAAPLASGQTYQMKEISDRGGDRVPVTLSFVGAQGDYFAPNLHPIINGQPTECQLDVRSTWPDGSISHALLSFCVDVQPGEHWNVTFGRSPLPIQSTFVPRWNLAHDLQWGLYFQEADGSESIQLFERELAEELLLWAHGGFPGGQSGAFGPLLREYEWKVRPKSREGVPHEHIELIVRWRLYSGHRAALTEIVVENCRINNPNQDDLEYAYVLGLAGSSWEEKIVEIVDDRHLFQTRFATEFWAGEEPPLIDVIPDLNYLAKTGLIPPLDASQPTTEAEADRFVAHIMRDTSRGEYNPATPLGVPLDHGPLFKYMPGAGDRHDIGWLPRWAYYSLNGFNPTGHKFTQAADMNGSGAFSVHFRDDSTGELGLRHHNPWWTKMQFKPRFSNPATANTAHEPLLGFTSYILTGRKIFLEELVSWTCRGLRDWYPNSGVIKTLGDRKGAWALRNLAMTAAILPDDHPLRGYFRDRLDATANHYTAKLHRDKPLGTFGDGSWKGSGRARWPCGMRVSPWMNAWFSTMSWMTWKLHGQQIYRDILDTNWEFFRSGYLTTDTWTAPNGELISADPRLLMQYSKLVSVYTPEIASPGGNNPPDWAVVQGTVVNLTNWAESQWYERIQVDKPVKSITNPEMPIPTAAPVNWRPKSGTYSAPPASKYDEYGPGRVGLLWIALHENLPMADQVMAVAGPWIDHQLDQAAAPHAPGTRYTGAAYE